MHGLHSLPSIDRLQVSTVEIFVGYAHTIIEEGVELIFLSWSIVTFTKDIVVKGTSKDYLYRALLKTVYLRIIAWWDPFRKAPRTLPMSI